MKKIEIENLVERAAENGRYFLYKLNQASQAEGITSQPHGMGLLLYPDIKSYRIWGGREPNTAVGRLMPYLTITKEEIDSLFKK
ncbi:MAG: hypothetical protein ACK5P6_01625 [Pseudobdellovibrionaceae bacterium]